MTTVENIPTKTNLRQLISRLLGSYQPVAVKQQSFFINDVPDDLSISADHEVLGTLLGSLFYLVARCGRSTSISVGAIAYDYTVILSIKDGSPINSYSILYEFDHLKMLSKKIGGFLDISTRQNKETIISFSFANQAESIETGMLRELKCA
jgi:hypothetical protein